MRRWFRVGLVLVVTLTLVIDTATAGRLFGRRSSCGNMYQSCPTTYCAVECPASPCAPVVECCPPVTCCPPVASCCESPCSEACWSPCGGGEVVVSEGVTAAPSHVEPGKPEEKSVTPKDDAKAKTDSPADKPVEKAKPKEAKPDPDDIFDQPAKETEKAKPAEAKPAEDLPAEDKPAEGKPAPKDDLFDEPAEKAKPAEKKPAAKEPADDLFDEPAAKPAEKPADKPAAKDAEPDLFDEPAEKAKPAPKADAKEPADELFDPPADKAKPADVPGKEAPPADDLFGPDPKKTSQDDSEYDDLFEVHQPARPAAPVKATVKGLVKAASQTRAAGEARLSVREWLDDSGNYGCRGTLVEIQPGKVRILKENGKHTTVSLDRLSRADQEYVREQTLKSDLSQKVTLAK